MDNRPIGFFDSGIGGMTSIPYLTRELPEERIVYFGDTARTPYGSKAASTIRNFSNQIVDFLLAQNVKMMVIVCNTISSTCLEELSERAGDVPVIGVIVPAAEKIARVCTSENRVGLIATKATVRSHAYEKAVSAINPDVSIFSKECPALVPLIEEGIIASDIMDLTLRYYMEDFILENRIDTLVLGCTHYPLIRGNIERLFPNLRIINPSEEVIGSIKRVLEERDIFAENSGYKNAFYASDLSENFTGMIDKICKGESVNVRLRSLEQE